MTASLIEMSGIQSWTVSRTSFDASGSTHSYRTKTATAAIVNAIGQARDVDISAGGVDPAGAAGVGSTLGAVVVISHLLRRALTQQPFGLEDHEEDQDGEDDGLVPLLSEREGRVVGLDE